MSRIGFIFYFLFFLNLYLYHTSQSLLMQVFGPPPIKECNFTFIFVFIVVFSTAPYADLWTTIHKMIYFSYTYSAYKFLQTCTYIACSQVHPPQHTHALLTSVREPPQFECLCRTNSRASVVIYSTHVLVCLRAFCSVHTARMTFGPLSTIPTWATACATAIS